MALTASGQVIGLRVAKRVSGTAACAMYIPDGEDLNKFNFSRAKAVVFYDAALGDDVVLLIDLHTHIY
jgi:hypothetical protein